MNLTFNVSNYFESVEFNLTFEMVSKVKGPKIDDFQIITNRKQPKMFEITFESLGSGTCMVIDFKDGTMKVFIFYFYEVLISTEEFEMKLTDRH